MQCLEIPELGQDPEFFGFDAKMQAKAPCPRQQGTINALPGRVAVQQAGQGLPVPTPGELSFPETPMGLALQPADLLRLLFGEGGSGGPTQPVEGQ